MSGQQAESAPENTGLSADQIQSLITTEEPVWRPEAETSTDDKTDETDAVETETEVPAETVEAAPVVETEKPTDEKVEAAPADDPTETPRERETRLSMEALQAKFALQLEHGSRLASQIGDLKSELKKKNARPDDESEAVDEDRGTRIERRLDDYETERTQEAVRGAVSNALARFAVRPDVIALKDEFVKASASYEDDLTAAMSETDPARVSRLTELILKAALADAKAMKNAEARKAAETVRDASKKRIAAAKDKAVTVGRTSQSTESAVAPLSASSSEDEIAAHYRKLGRTGW